MQLKENFTPSTGTAGVIELFFCNKFLEIICMNERKTMTRKSLISIITVLLSFLFFACQLDVPVKEMTSAKQKIEEAESFKASKYAPDDLKNAEALLLESHEFLKKEDTDKARESALKAYKAASSAVEKSLPPLASDTLKKASESLESAENANAAVYATDEFKKAGELKNLADKSNSEKKYRDSYKLSLESISTSNLAKSKSLENMPELMKKLNDLVSRHNTLAGVTWKDSAVNELAEAKTKLSLSDTNLQHNKLKNTFLNMDEAKAALDSAQKKIADAEEKDRLEKLRIEKENTDKKIAEVRTRLEDLKNKPGSEFAKDHISVAESNLNEASQLNNNNDTVSAKLKIDAAENTMDAADIKIRKSVLNERIAGLKKQHTELTEKDTSGKIKNDLDKSAGLIGEAEKLLESEDYKGSSVKADEAEGILNSLTTTLAAKDTEKDKQGEVKTEEKKEQVIYTVKLNRNKRDCLWRIAGRFYKEPHLWPVIYMANRDKIKDPDLIFPGQKFIIPPKPAKVKNRWNNIYKKETPVKREPEMPENTEK